MLRNITLSADAQLIEAVRKKATSTQSTLNVEFRKWLADYTPRRKTIALCHACIACCNS